MTREEDLRAAAHAAAQRLNKIPDHVRPLLRRLLTPPRPEDKTVLRELTKMETRRIGFALGDHLLRIGHPATCNGGNPRLVEHHAEEVRMLVDEGGNFLQCPKCGRQQSLPSGWNHD